ncbi:MAG: glycosyltransferase family 4 protein [Deltaproteobacteria bacterium]|nr:glycosyltransferase family 4 protein [Deltaproteobacteria bacterium]
MRVALVHDWLTGTRGGEKCLEVLCELFPEADLYTLVYVPEKVSPAIARMNIRPSWLNRLPLIARTYRYYLPLMPRAIEGFDLPGYDLILSSSHCVAKGVFPRRALHIAYIHAPMRYVWDQHDAYFASEGWSLAQSGMALCRRYLQRWDVACADRVDYFVANSNNVGDKIRKLYGREATTIYPPVEVDRFLLGGASKDYYLVVSALVPYKRVDLAIAACNRLGAPLKIVGDGPLRQRLQRLAGPNVEFLGWVHDQQLAQLYSDCKALLFPGEEDFGIVALEAQACGRPVIAYGKGGVLESVIGVGANVAHPTGVFFPEQTEASLIEAIKGFERSMSTFDPVCLRAHAAKFSRERFKDEIARFIAEKLRERGIVRREC